MCNLGTKTRRQSTKIHTEITKARMLLNNLGTNTRRHMNIERIVDLCAIEGIYETCLSSAPSVRSYPNHQTLRAVQLRKNCRFEHVLPLGTLDVPPSARQSTFG